MAAAEANIDGGVQENQFDRDKIMAELDEKGYCVIPGVLTSQECDGHIASYRRWFDQFDGSYPFQRHSIIQSYRIGHFRSTWEIRLATKKVFETVWQTKKLVSSFDAVAISPPPAQDDVSGFRSPEAQWLHLDQPARRKGLHCYQGALYLEEASDMDYCFRVLEGSHNHTDDFYREDDKAARNSNRTSFFRLLDRHVKRFEQWGCPLTNVPVPKGGMVLWDSRTVHDNCKPEQGRPNADRWRFAAFVAMAPARWVTPRDLGQKREAYRKLLMTSHWPAQGVSFFPERRTDVSSGVPLLAKLPPVAKTTEVKLLAGMDEYDFEDGQPNGPTWDPEWTEEA